MDMSFNHLVIDIVDGCNAKCKYCTTGIGNNLNITKNYTLISLELLKKGLDYILNEKLITKNSHVELFSWGEPFIHPKLDDICSLLRQYGLRYRLSTNGSIYKEISESNIAFLDDICFSISGFSQKTYSKTHGLDLENVLKNISKMSKYFNSLGYYDKIIMNFHVYQHNYHEIEIARTFCMNNNVQFVPHIAYIADFNLFYKYLNKKLCYDELNLMSKELFLSQYDSELIQTGVNDNYTCKQELSLVLDCNLNILPCCFMTNKHILGNLFELDYSEIVNRRTKFKLCTKCKNSRISNYVNQDQYFDNEYKRLASLPSRFYIDIGNGYNENSTIVGAMIPQFGKYMCKIKIPEKCESLRFDPCEGARCILADLEIYTESNPNMRFDLINGNYVENMIIFDNVDPQIKISTHENQGEWLSVICRIERLS